VSDTVVLRGNVPGLVGNQTVVLVQTRPEKNPPQATLLLVAPDGTSSEPVFLSSGASVRIGDTDWTVGDITERPEDASQHPMGPPSGRLVLRKA